MKFVLVFFILLLMLVCCCYDILHELCHYRIGENEVIRPSEIKQKLGSTATRTTRSKSLLYCIITTIFSTCLLCL